MHRLDEKALLRHLTEHLPGFTDSLAVRQFETGQSNPTYLLTAGDHRYVLRKKPPGELLPKAHLVEREFRVMKALAGTDVPVPRMLHLCEDPSVIGTTFFVMEHLDGRTLRDASLPELDPAERRLLHEEMVRVLAALHVVDYERLGLGDFGRSGSYFERQTSRWIRQYRAAETDAIEAMERLIQWLPDHLPDDEMTALVHGDYRIDNLIFDRSTPRVIGVIDWELATLGHPLADFAYFCQAYHVATPYHPSLAPLAGAASGIPTEAETIAAYCRSTGRGRIENWEFYVAFSMFRLAAIVQGVYRRGLSGNASSESALELGRLVRVQADAAWNLVR